MNLKLCMNLIVDHWNNEESIIVVVSCFAESTLGSLALVDDHDEVDYAEKFFFFLSIYLIIFRIKYILLSSFV